MLEIADNYNLYVDAKNRISNNDVVIRMKKDIVLEPIVSNLQVERSNRDNTFNLAFATPHRKM